MSDTASDTGAATLVAQPVREFINQPALDAAGLRKGAWIMTPDGVGILTGCDADGAVIVTLCKACGRNVMKLDENDKPVPDSRTYGASDVRIAFLEEIPADRISGTEPEVLAAMGYVSKETAQ